MTPPAITYYVVVLAGEEGDTFPIRPVSRLVQQEESVVEQKLTTRSYDVLGRYARSANAQGLVQQLHALGIKALMVSDQEIRGHLIVTMEKANRGAGGLAFRDFDDKPLYCPFDDLAGICVLEIPLENGELATLIDLHRKSANITPRLDVSLFDFPTTLQRPGATFEDFLIELEEKAQLKMDRGFTQNYQAVNMAAANFASRPAVFAPPPSRMASPYDSHAFSAANLYSFVRCTQLRK